MTALWTPSALANPTAAQLATLVPLLATRSVDLPLASNTTPAADPALQMAVPANTTWEVTALLLYGAVGTSLVGGFKIGWSGPVGSTFDWVPHGKIDSDGANTAAAIWTAHLAITDQINFGGTAANTGRLAARPYGYLTVAGTPGTFALLWSQATSNGTATILRARSRLLLRQVA